MLSITLEELERSVPWLVEQIKLGNTISILDENNQEIAVVTPTKNLNLLDENNREVAVITPTKNPNISGE
ncbi:hypothetical protein [Candidatus Albibeggiatoa sp. nov. BB20]|uniref:hypothetical protein n=1 Tax=Candidatus Albibeggiatoa sp. nov. BB20 TaxID=3162723 RepID=UPI0033657573